ncbi:MAG: hypothetical protein IIC95_04665 [Chloroflexi bacterium]|nr:hypothetical protein [Chloroflexota bacterium]
MGQKENQLKQIRTFQGDVAEALNRQKESLVSIQRAEKSKKASSNSLIEPNPENPRRRQFFLLLLGSLLLFILSAVGVWYVYDEFVRRTATPVTTVPANRFISPNSEVNLDLTDFSRTTFISSLSDTAADTSKGELRHIVLKETMGDEDFLLRTDKFLELLESRAPGRLAIARHRAFDSLALAWPTMPMLAMPRWQVVTAKEALCTSVRSCPTAFAC